MPRLPSLPGYPISLSSLNLVALSGWSSPFALPTVPTLCACRARLYGTGSSPAPSPRGLSGLPSATAPPPATLASCQSLAELSAYYAQQPAPSAPLFMAVLDRAVALRGGAVLPWDLASCPPPLATSAAPGDGPYHASLGAGLLGATRAAAFRLAPREYERVLAALRDLGEDDPALHDGAAKGFLWDVALSASRTKAAQPPEAAAHRALAKDSILRVYAEALHSGLAIPRVLQLAAGGQGQQPSSRLPPALLQRITAQRDSSLRALSLDPPAAAAAAAAATAAPFALRLLHQPSTLQASSLWLATPFLQQAATRLLAMASGSIEKKLSLAAAGGAHSQLGRAAPKAPLMAPLAEAATLLTLGVLARSSSASASSSSTGSSAGVSRGDAALLRACSAAVRALLRGAVVSLPLLQVHDFWAADATSRSAGGEVVGGEEGLEGSSAALSSAGDSSHARRLGLYASSSHSLFYGPGALLGAYGAGGSSSGSGGSGDEGGGWLGGSTTSSSTSSSSTPSKRRAQSDYRTHHPRHAQSAHAQDWAPALLAASAVHLECGLLLAAAAPQAAGVREAAGDALEAMRMQAQALRLAYTGVDRTCSHLDKSWRRWCEAEGRRRGGGGSSSSSGSSSATVGEDRDRGSGLAPGIDMLAVAAVREGAASGGSGGAAGGQEGLHPKFAATLACLAMAVRTVQLLCAVHPVVQQAERALQGGVGSGTGSGAASGAASEEVRAALGRVLAACARASSTLSPLHPVLYYSQQAGGWGGAQAEEWAVSVAEGVRVCQGLGGGVLAQLQREAVRVHLAAQLGRGQLQQQQQVQQQQQCQPFWCTGAGAGEGAAWVEEAEGGSGGASARLLAAWATLGLEVEVEVGGGGGGRQGGEGERERLSRQPLLAVPRVSAVASAEALEFAGWARGVEERGGGKRIVAAPASQLT